MPLRFYILTCLLALSWSKPCFAEKPDCAKLYSRIDYGQNFSVVRKLLRPSSVQEARLVVQAKEQLKVKDVFPRTAEQKIGFDTTKTVPYIDPKITKRYQDEFNSLMKARVRAGLFPRQELVAWRSWMKKHQSKYKYPSIAGKTEDLIKFMQGDGTLAEFFDVQFGLYINEAKGIPVESIPSYLQIHYPTIYARIKAYASRNAHRLIGFGATVTAPVVAFAGAEQLTEILKAFVAPFIDPTKKLAKDTAKSVSEKGVDELKKLAIQGPDKYQEKLAWLRESQNALAVDDFTRLSTRTKFREKMEEYDLRYLKYLPEFHDVVLSLDKNWDEKWMAALKEKLPSITPLRNTYDTRSSTLDTLRSLINSRGTPATPEELDNLAKWSGQMSKTEDQIADALADWELTRLSLGKDKIDPVVDREYERLYGDYLESMEPEKLRKKVAVRMETVIAKLEAWADKTKGNKEVERPLPVPGRVPEVPAAFEYNP